MDNMPFYSPFNSISDLRSEILLKGLYQACDYVTFMELLGTRKSNNERLCAVETYLLLRQIAPYLNNLKYWDR